MHGIWICWMTIGVERKVSCDDAHTQPANDTAVTATINTTLVSYTKVPPTPSMKFRAAPASGASGVTAPGPAAGLPQEGDGCHERFKERSA